MIDKPSTNDRPLPDQINRMLAEHSPFHRLIDASVDRIEDDNIVCRMPIRTDFFHAGGVLHGGVTYSLADSAVALLVLYRVGLERKVFTIEGKLNYLASVAVGTEGTLFAKAKIVSLGQTTAVVDADVYTDAGRLLCHGIFTYAIR